MNQVQKYKALSIVANVAQGDLIKQLIKENKELKEMLNVKNLHLKSLSERFESFMEFMQEYCYDEDYDNWIWEKYQDAECSKNDFWNFITGSIRYFYQDE